MPTGTGASLGAFESPLPFKCRWTPVTSTTGASGRTAARGAPCAERTSGPFLCGWEAREPGCGNRRKEASCELHLLRQTPCQAASPRDAPSPDAPAQFASWKTGPTTPVIVIVGAGLGGSCLQPDKDVTPSLQRPPQCLGTWPHPAHHQGALPPVCAHLADLVIVHAVFTGHRLHPRDTPRLARTRHSGTTDSSARTGWGGRGTLAPCGGGGSYLAIRCCGKFVFPAMVQPVLCSPVLHTPVTATDAEAMRRGTETSEGRGPHSPRFANRHHQGAAPGPLLCPLSASEPCCVQPTKTERKHLLSDGCSPVHRVCALRTRPSAAPTLTWEELRVHFWRQCTD